MRLVQVKSLSGFNYFVADRVIAIQTTPTGQSAVVLEGGVIVQSSETPQDIAARIEAFYAEK